MQTHHLYLHQPRKSCTLSSTKEPKTGAAAASVFLLGVLVWEAPLQGKIQRFNCYMSINVVSPNKA